ncbi:MIT C-terminal domain-containing protein [Belnapia moabensis]|uniref:MIT C-terminal domain-containing protein n=1 Tax=Belnapia moabensis TaxID=365533 RepID=UPI0005BDCAEA|nr:MIT C-terminal domain-containing protein [Belnapia moabensis]
MTPKNPLRIRQDLEKARGRIDLLVGVLRENQRERRWRLGEECARAADGLARLLQENTIPDDYKVAVIGRFKAGKSSFVNVLLGSKLAGEDTNPETAAVTTFRAGERILAKINLISKETWDDLKALHGKDPSDPAAHRIANWLKFSGKDPKPSASSQVEVFDMTAIEREHIRLGGHTLTISLPQGKGAEADRKAGVEFRRKIKQFTSSTKPHHCLVESIEIETPSLILQQGVTLVDTPGLDDTERFRVHLTERAVEDVDAVLFLTKSGASYGQAEKDFLLRLLRKGTVRQLVFVVTQVDQTYDQHVRQARDQDEDAEPIGVRIEAERRRIRAEIEATLDELAGDAGAASTQRFREQLDSIEIAFTSAANHRDHERGERAAHPIDHDDPGGMRAVTSTLFRILSTESRLATTKRAVEQGTGSILQEMLTAIEKRRLVVEGIRNREVAEEKLATFRRQFEENGLRFGEVGRQASDVLKKELAVKARVGAVVSQNVALEADGILASYETDDAGRHWKTRRSGHWGYMADLQNRVANRVFPKVSEHLNSQTEEFGTFVDTFRAHLGSLSADAAMLIRDLEIGEELQLDIGTSLGEFLEKTLETQHDLIVAEEASIVALLEDFVDDEVEEKIAAARETVARVWGRGTTVSQTSEVRAFYREVRGILREAVQSHVERRFREFAQTLTEQAEALPERSISQVRAEIERASVDIKAAAEATLEGQKELFNRLVDQLKVATRAALLDVEVLLAEEDDTRFGASAPALVAAPSSAEPVPSGKPAGRDAPLLKPSFTVSEPPISDEEAIKDPVAAIRKRATRCVKRHTLRNGEKSWPFSRIFLAEYLQGATEIWLIDPYLAQPHQRRNLREFLEVVTAAAKPKNVHILTREMLDPTADSEREYYEGLDRTFFEKAGAKVTYTLDGHIHDRFVVLDTGYVFKLGRGLDIYKPVAGLGGRDPALRQTRACEIDVFAAEEPEEGVEGKSPA